jgi:uncharacterized surface protein with fasciclin (FAS1) repeats
MEALRITTMAVALFSLLATGCDQRQDTNRESEAEALELAENANSLPDAQVAPPVSTSRDIPGGDDASRVTARSLIDNASANDDLVSFSELLRSANMVKNLSGTGPYTLFAPTEKALKALPGSILEDLAKPENEEQLQHLLNNHIIAGKLTTDDLQDGAILKTAAGQQLKVSKRDGKVRVNGALIEDADGMSSNGVLHTVNKVLLPVAEE